MRALSSPTGIKPGKFLIEIQRKCVKRMLNSVRITLVIVHRKMLWHKLHKLVGMQLRQDVIRVSNNVLSQFVLRKNLVQMNHVLADQVKNINNVTVKLKYNVGFCNMEYRSDIDTYR